MLAATLGVAMQATETNPNDEIRRTILKYFCDRNANATSRFGKKGSAVKISDVKRELKTLHELTQQEVMSNLTYLIDRGWVKTVDQGKTVATKGGTTVPSVVTFYEVSVRGDREDRGSLRVPASRPVPGDQYRGGGSQRHQLQPRLRGRALIETGDEGLPRPPPHARGVRRRNLSTGRFTPDEHSERRRDHKPRSGGRAARDHEAQ